VEEDSCTACEARLFFESLSSSGEKFGSGEGSGSGDGDSGVVCRERHALVTAGHL
jgi:hypothetical protein